MMLLVLTEGNGVTTHMSIGADYIAVEMADFFENDIGLEVTIDQIDRPVEIDEQEMIRANLYTNEWRMFGKQIFAVK